MEIFFQNPKGLTLTAICGEVVGACLIFAFLFYFFHLFVSNKNVNCIFLNGMGKDLVILILPIEKEIKS